MLTAKLRAAAFGIVCEIGRYFCRAVIYEKKGFIPTLPEEADSGRSEYNFPLNTALNDAARHFKLNLLLYIFRFGIEKIQNMAVC